MKVGRVPLCAVVEATIDGVGEVYAYLIYVAGFVCWTILLALRRESCRRTGGHCEGADWYTGVCECSKKAWRVAREL